ncbi:MAG: hypothetical protein LC776_18075, partial [Acidobacteria bacterium]|nr:hypothetical protein [Acidobacteriota bacterium]
PQFYLSFNQIPVDRLPGYTRRINLLTRTDVEPTSLTSAVRGQIAALNKDQAVFNVRTMEQIVSESVAPRRFSMMLLSVFAVVALTLASIGLYGMMSYAVAQRTREIGLRMTLGAQRWNVLRLVIGHGMKLALAGVVLGLVASAALTRTIKNLLFGMTGEPGPSAGEGARGFVGVAFRIASDASKYECFYLPPTNGRADDQVRRNHSVQYIAFPDFPWQRLRKEFPEKYESYVDLVPGKWTKLKIEVRGDKARLYVHGAQQPTLLVNDLKQGQSQGGIALWVGPGTVAHFSNLRVSK